MHNTKLCVSSFKGAVYSAHLLPTRNYFTSIDKETHTLYIYKTVWSGDMQRWPISTTYSKKETNTMNFVFYTPTVVFSAQKKFILATVRLSPAESNSKGVFRRGLYHNVEFLSISTLAFCIHTLSTTKKFITMAMCRKTQRYGIGLWCHKSYAKNWPIPLFGSRDELA